MANQHSERTPREILEAGAAWVTEFELQQLVETVEAAEWAMTSHAERARYLEEQHGALRRAIEDMGDHVVSLEKIGKRALGIDA